MLWIELSLSSLLTLPAAAEATAAEATAAAAQPDWAGLSDDLWQRIAAAARVDAWNHDSPALGCVQWYQVVARASCVSKGLRSALLGPGADVLWQTAFLSARHPSLTARQSRGLNALVTAQVHRAAEFELSGGGWDPHTLRKLLSRFGQQLRGAILVNINDPAEAAVLSRVLPALPVRRVVFIGRAACLLPATAGSVDMTVRLPPAAGAEVIDQAPFQRFLGCLRPLKGLTRLELDLQPWRLTSSFVQHISKHHPLLRELRLRLAVSPAVGSHALHSLRQLPTLQLWLGLIDYGKDGALAVLLQQLQGAQLHSFVIVADDLSETEERLLALCSVTELALRLKNAARRLQLLPPGAAVTYLPPS